MIGGVLAAILACAGPPGESGRKTEPEQEQSREPVSVWIDADPSIRPGGYEVDDGFALIQALRSPELDVQGVSLVYGNASLDVEIPIGQEIVERFGPPGLGVYPGAAGADERGLATDASEALAEALRQQPLRILVLGPATNVATVLTRHAELGSQITELIAVAGRRPGQRFITEGVTEAPHRDFNFEHDAEAFQVILDAGGPLTLTPWEISSQVWLRSRDVDRLEQGPPHAQWLVQATRDWLKQWHDRYGVDGFNPYDTLAVGYLTSPDLIACEMLPITILELADDQALAAGKTDVPSKPYLLVGSEVDSPYRVTYC